MDILTRAMTFLPRPLARLTTAYICPAPHTSTLGHLPSPLSSTFFLLVSVTLLGALLRRACYSALGRMFTFAHTTRADHILVTWGPYAYARHAGYTAVVLAYGGMIALIWQEDAWLRSCTDGSPSSFLKATHSGNDSANSNLRAISALVARMSAVIFSAWTVCVVLALLSRAPREDATLKERFGEQWEAYRRRVPWKFLPFIV